MPDTVFYVVSLMVSNKSDEMASFTRKYETINVVGAVEERWWVARGKRRDTEVGQKGC